MALGKREVHPTGLNDDDDHHHHDNDQHRDEDNKVGKHTKEEEKKNIPSFSKVISSLSTKEDKNERRPFLDEVATLSSTTIIVAEEKEVKDISSSLKVIVSF